MGLVYHSSKVDKTVATLLLEKLPMGLDLLMAVAKCFVLRIANYSLSLGLLRFRHQQCVQYVTPTVGPRVQQLCESFLPFHEPLPNSTRFTQLYPHEELKVSYQLL
jgi:hypothetical protein